MKLAVLASPDSWYAADLRRAAAAQHEVVTLPFSLVAATLNEELRVSSDGRNLAEFNAVLVRTMPPGSLEQVVFRMDALTRLEAAGTCVLNPPRAIEAAVDKFLTSAKLQAAGLPTPRTAVCQDVDEALAAFERLGRVVVCKPLFGSERRGLTRLIDVDLAVRAFKMLAQFGAVIYLQEFVQHEGFDLRLFVLGQRVFGMKRLNPNDWRTNVSRGAKTEPLEVTDAWRELARRAADAVGAPIAGVDLLIGRDGREHVLEVNAVPGWKALARTLQIDIAALVLEFVAERASSRDLA